MKKFILIISTASILASCAAKTGEGSLDADGFQCKKEVFYTHSHLGKVYNRGYYYEDEWHMQHVESGEIYTLPCSEFKRVKS